MLKTEERNPNTKHIDKATTMEMLGMIQQENYNAVRAIDPALPDIAKAVDAVAKAFSEGGRLIYAGCGTSGRLAVMDAAECPPTYGVGYDMVTACIAGGEKALTRTAEHSEDSAEAGRNDILAKNITSKDIVMGISAAGFAAYVASAMQTAKEIGCVTISLSSNSPTLIGDIADIAIFTDTGAEVVTGSTRMKAGSAQKMVLNMITTAAMIKTGKVYENLMINLRPMNKKLEERMERILSDILEIDIEKAKALLEKNDWSLRKAIENA